jgi:hypothetical protein
MIVMTHTTRTVRQDPADLAESLFTHDDAELDQPFTILMHKEGSGLVERREALRPVYEAIVARIGPPTLMGGTAHGPSVRWSNRERTLLLSGDHGEATLSAHQAESFARDEFWSFDSHRRMPYTWQLDRHGPGHDPGWTFYGHSAANDWTSAEERLAGMLASWAEHMPVQAPGDWAGFKLWTARDWRKHTMIVSFNPSDTNREFQLAIEDRDHEQTPEHAAEMRARGWQDVDEHRWWRTELPETDPEAPAALARVVITNLRARATWPAEVHAWDISAGDNGKLWVPGIGVEVHPRRGEHY